MIIKEKTVSVTPKKSLDKEKLEVFEQFAEQLKKPVAVINKSFDDIDLIKEEKVHKDNRLTVCNGVLCDPLETVGMSVDLNKKTVVRELDISSLNDDLLSKKDKVYSGAFKFVPYCGYGEPIFDRNGNVLAEVSPNKNVFFLFDALPEGIDVEIVKYVLNEVLFLIIGKGFNDEKSSSASFLYKNIASKKIDEKIKAINETIEKANDKVQLMQQKLVTMIRLKDQAENMISAEYQLRNTIAEKVKQDLSDMSKLGGYSLIRFLEDRVFGVTEEIRIDYNGKTYNLGKYRVEVGFDNGSVRVFNVGKNKHKESQDVQHPHVRGNNVCMGNIQSDLPQYIAKYEFSVVFDLMYQLLSNYNNGSPHSSITNWPTV